MSTKTFWRPGDGRSLRRDRVPLDLRVPGRMMPLEPLAVHDTSEAWLPLDELEHALRKIQPLVLEHAHMTCEPLDLNRGHYGELAALAFGGQRRELLTPGLYVRNCPRTPVLDGLDQRSSTCLRAP